MRMRYGKHRTCWLCRDCANRSQSQFDLRLSVVLNQGHPDFLVEFQDPYVTRQMAEEVYGTLIQAIECLLATDLGSDDSQSTAGHVEYPESHPNLTLFNTFIAQVGGVEKSVADAFWKAQFADLQGSHLPDKPATPQGPRYNNVSFDMRDLHLTGHDFEEDVILRAAWTILTARLSDSYETLFGSASVDSEAASILPIRILLDQEKSIGFLLNGVQQQTREMLPFKRMRLEQIACISHEAAVACKFRSVLVTCDNQGTSKNVDWQEELGMLHKYALMMELQPGVQDARIHIKYDTTAIELSTLRRFVHQLEHVLHQLLDIKRRDDKVRNVTITSNNDLNEIWNWNARLPPPVEGCVHELIIEKVRQSPDADAIDAWDGTLTYGQLDELSSRLAHQLISNGIGKGSIVPLCFERSMWMPVSALAVMKTGAASVAVEMAHPEQRIRSIVDQAFASSKQKLILSSVEHETVCQGFGGNVVFAVDQDLFNQSTLVTKPELPSIHPSDVLYIVFTSGTTGNPKGVIISHQNFCSAIAYQRDQLGFNRNSRVFSFASYAFDVFWLNLLKTLSSGGCLCIPSAEERMDYLGGALEKYKATIVDLTPSVARSIQPSSVLSGLSTLILGGEAISTNDLNLVGETTQIKVAYGPAECTPTSTILDMTTSIEGGIGRAAGTCTWIVSLENSDVLAPVGDAGELWIEGPVVGQGYLHDPEKTAEAFVQDPPWLRRGSPDGQHLGRCGRLYRTGDLVRYNADGSLIFLGRRDSQIKIRGQRVELGDIESHVRQAIEIAGGATAARAQVIVEHLHLNGAPNKSLVAFVKLESSPSTPPSGQYDDAVQHLAAAATDHLATQLPVYMLPSVYVPMQTMPITTTGKIDRRQLQQIGETFKIRDIGSLPGNSVERRQPETDTEILMQGLWAQVLEIDTSQISANDNFFRLGGDSIRAMRLVAMARHEGLAFTVRDVFQHSILHDLCDQCQNEDRRPNT